MIRHWRRALSYHWLERCKRSKPRSPQVLLTCLLLKIFARIPRLASWCNDFLGQISAATGGPQDAVRYYDKALTSERVQATNIYHHRGVALVSLGRFPEAEASLRQSIECQPLAWWSYLTLGELLLRQARIQAAEELFRKVIELNSTVSWAYYNLLEAQLLTVGFEAALDQWLDGILAAPLLEHIPVRRGLWWGSALECSTAHLEKLKRIHARYPQFDDIGIALSVVLSAQGEVGAGTECLTQCMTRAWEHNSGVRVDKNLPVKDPEFIIIGTGKGGSTALYHYLIDHPLICPASAKEINFWITGYDYGYAWYRACFMPIPSSSDQITGEGSIQSLWHEEAPQRVAAFRQDMKLLLIIRDPVARAYSEYQMWKRLGHELPDWEDLVEAELQLLPTCPLEPEQLPEPHSGHRMLLESAVLPFLKRWLRHFPIDQFLILRNEDLSRDVIQTVGRAYDFLGLPSHQLSSTRRRNEGSYSKMSPEVELKLRQWYQPHENALNEFLAMKKV